MTRHFSALGRSFARLLRDDRGGEVMEYALTLGFMAAASYVMIQVVGTKFVDIWERIDRALAQLG